MNCKNILFLAKLLILYNKYYLNKNTKTYFKKYAYKLSVLGCRNLFTKIIINYFSFVFFLSKIVYGIV